MISYTLSLRYAKSIFSLAKETNSIDSYYEQLKEVDIVLEKSADLKEVLESQRVAAKDKLHLVEKIFYSQNLAKNVYNFLKFLALRNRFMIFKEILKVFDDLYHQHNKSLVVKITTVENIDAQKKEEIIKQLKNSFQCEVELEEIIDKTILGGFIAQIKLFLLFFVHLYFPLSNFNYQAFIMLMIQVIKYFQDLFKNHEPFES